MKPQVTMIVPFYRQPQMLLKQLETWNSYSDEAQYFFDFVIVDDCSPEPAEDVIRPWAYTEARRLSDPGFISLYRIDKDVPWNRGMARNLGTTVAETKWVLHVDTDHVLPAESAEFLMKMWEYTSPVYWYRFPRFRVGAADETRRKDKANPDAEFVKIHPHIDSYLCTKNAYWKAGGYNEDFSGVLGGGSPFLKEMEIANGPSAEFGCPLWVYTRHAVPDSSEHTLSRDPKLFKQRKADIMKAHGTLRGHHPLRLPWHKVF